jgi:hypothetical protein
MPLAELGVWHGCHELVVKSADTYIAVQYTGITISCREGKARCTFLAECCYVTCDVFEVRNRESYKIVITLE